jgi:streptogramin lyase
MLLASSATAQQPGFRLHGRFTGIGACLKTLIGPGPEPGSQRLYASHIYGGSTLDIVAVDPLTGKADVFPGPLAGEYGAWAMALGADGQVYVGTLPTAHVLRLDWRQRKLVDMGRPSATEDYIWQLALGTDQKLYGCTNEHAKLVRFDPATRKGEDLGRMDPTELYAREVAADDKGFVYVGIGTVKRHLVAYEIATGKHRDILPAEFAGGGSCSAERGEDGVVYGSAGAQHLRLEGWNAIAIPPDQVRRPAPLRLADGRTVSYDGRTVSVTDPKTGQVETRNTDYRGKSQSYFRIGLGPDGRLYGSTAMPIHFVWADPDSERWEEIGQPGGGEIYSFLAWKDVLITAAYGGDARIMIYRPGKPWAPDTKPSGNPWLINYDGENSGWRPLAMVAGPGDKVYIGATAGYGLLGGPLCVLDPATGKVDQYLNLVKDQSVNALAALPDGPIVGGTTVGGGGGSHSTQTEAKLFLWDPAKREKLFETVPVPGEDSISALAVGKDGMVYGFAGGTFFVFDPKEQKVVAHAPHSLGSVIYNGVFPGPDGELYGLSSRGIFSIAAAARRPSMLATYPGGVGGGVAIRGREVFFTSGPEIVSYTLP